MIKDIKTLALPFITLVQPFMFELIETVRTLKVDENGCLDVDLSGLDDLAYDKLIVRKSYLRLARLMIENFLASVVERSVSSSDRREQARACS